MDIFQKCSSDVFVEGLLVQSLRYGLFAELQGHLGAVGGSIDKWEDFLAKSCQFLEGKRLYAVLYKIQLCMKVCTLYIVFLRVFIALLLTGTTGLC